MELRVLRYFLAAAQEGSISRAAEYLHLTQPTLSRQLIELEEELGAKLFLRNGRGLRLTEDGVRFRQRAAEILELSDKTLAEFTGGPGELAGEVAIGTVGEETTRLIVRVVAALHKVHPKLQFQIYTGSHNDITERVDKGLLDFGAITQPEDLDRYDHLHLPCDGEGGILVQREDPLSSLGELRPQHLRGSQLLVPQHATARAVLARWLGPVAQEVEFVVSFNTASIAGQLVGAGFGRGYCTQRGFERRSGGRVVFLPLADYPKIDAALVWKKHRRLPAPSKAFLAQFHRELEMVQVGETAQKAEENK